MFSYTLQQLVTPHGVNMAFQALAVGRPRSMMQVFPLHCVEVDTFNEVHTLGLCLITGDVRLGCSSTGLHF